MFLPEALGEGHPEQEPMALDFGGRHGGVASLPLSIGDGVASGRSEEETIREGVVLPAGCCWVQAKRITRRDSGCRCTVAPTIDPVVWNPFAVVLSPC